MFTTKKTRALIQNTKTSEFLKEDLVERANLPEKLGGSLRQIAFSAEVLESYQRYLDSKETFRL